jgi:YbbR domain-containing protein
VNLRGWVRRVFLHNLPLKIMSLILATGLWYAVSREPVSEVEVSVPVEFQNVPENLEIGSEHIPRAEIRLRGPARIVRELKASDVRAEIDLAGSQPGERTFDLSGRHIRTLPELSVVQIVPSQLHLDLDLRETRELEIRARVMGSFAQGLQVARATTEPAHILVTGPKRHVDTLEEALTDPVDASGTMHRGIFMTHVYLSDPLVQVVNPSPVQVTVIMERAPERPAVSLVPDTPR